ITVAQGMDTPERRDAADATAQVETADPDITAKRAVPSRTDANARVQGNESLTDTTDRVRAVASEKTYGAIPAAIPDVAAKEDAAAEMIGAVGAAGAVEIVFPAEQAEQARNSDVPFLPKVSSALLPADMGGTKRQVVQYPAFTPSPSLREQRPRAVALPTGGITNGRWLRNVRGMARKRPGTFMVAACVAFAGLVGALILMFLLTAMPQGNDLTIVRHPQIFSPQVQGNAGQTPTIAPKSGATVSPATQSVNFTLTSTAPTATPVIISQSTSVSSNSSVQTNSSGSSS